MQVACAVAVEYRFQINRNTGELGDAAGRGIPLPSSLACAATAGLTLKMGWAICLTGTAVIHAKHGSTIGKESLSGEV
jgi:hypothetical protein